MMGVGSKCLLLVVGNLLAGFPIVGRDRLRIIDQFVFDHARNDASGLWLQVTQRLDGFNSVIGPRWQTRFDDRGKRLNPRRLGHFLE